MTNFLFVDLTESAEKKVLKENGVDLIIYFKLLRLFTFKY
jgi:hypothetical protein